MPAEPRDELVRLADLGAGRELGPAGLMGELAQPPLEPVGDAGGIVGSLGRLLGQELGDELGDEPRTGAIAEVEGRHGEGPQDFVDVGEERAPGEELDERRPE